MDIIDLPIETITKCNDIEFKVVEDAGDCSCINCIFDIGGALEDINCDNIPYTCLAEERKDDTDVKFVEC